MDNRYYKYDCPALMSDGRFISSYVRSSVFDQYVRKMNKIETAQEYRHFLQNNGSNIINNMKAYLHESQTCKVEGKCLPINRPNEMIVNDINDSIISQHHKSHNDMQHDNEIQNQHNYHTEDDEVVHNYMQHHNKNHTGHDRSEDAEDAEECNFCQS